MDAGLEDTGSIRDRLLEESKFYDPQIEINPGSKNHHALKN